MTDLTEMFQNQITESLAIRQLMVAVLVEVANNSGNAEGTLRRISESLSKQADERDRNTAIDKELIGQFQVHADRIIAEARRKLGKTP